MNGFWLTVCAMVLISSFPSEGARGQTSSTVPEAVEIGSWASLVPEGLDNYEDPFVSLEASQLLLLGQIARLRDRGVMADDNSDQGTQLRNLEAEARDSGLDIDYLWSIRAEITQRRRRAATLPNEALAGQRISLVGFAVPGRSMSDGNATFYLVPERGMCSHTPPPHPNQIVQIIVGPKDALTYLHQPVRVTGPIEIERSINQQFVLDGPVTMDSAYTMTADKVEVFGPGKSNSTDPTPTDRMRAFWRAARQ